MGEGEFEFLFPIFGRGRKYLLLGSNGRREGGKTAEGQQGRGKELNAHPAAGSGTGWCLGAAGGGKRKVARAKRMRIGEKG